MVEWDRRVAREAEHQARIEAAFDWADEHDRLGDVARALEWLDKASALSGGLTPAYREKRLRLSREVLVRELDPGGVHSIRNVGEDAVDLVYGLSRPGYG